MVQTKIDSLSARRTVPIQGWRSTDKTAKYMKVQHNNAEFDKVKNFLNSDIGELASDIQGITKRLKYPKGVLYYVYGFRSYVPVSRPSRNCDLRVQKCEHEPVFAALSNERDEILKEIRSWDEFFDFNVHRNFDLKISSNYGKYPKVNRDKFTDDFKDNEIRLKLNDRIFDGSIIFPSILKLGLLNDDTKNDLTTDDRFRENIQQQAESDDDDSEAEEEQLDEREMPRTKPPSLPVIPEQNEAGQGQTTGASVTVVSAVTTAAMTSAVTIAKAAKVSQGQPAAISSYFPAVATTNNIFYSS